MAINYKERLAKAFEAIIVITEKQAPLSKKLHKNVRRIAMAQLKNLEGVQNRA